MTRNQPAPHLQHRLLFFSPSTPGGLADYAHEQAKALAEADVDVKMLTTGSGNLRGHVPYQVELLPDDNSQGPKSRIARRFVWTRQLFRNLRVLARETQAGHFGFVLMGAFSEYLAPLWAGRFRCLARTGVKFGCVVHDPVRDYVVGPMWWHRRSVAAAYSFLSEAFVHEAIQLDTIRSMPGLRTTVIPHGPYRFPEPTATREQMRKRLNLPGDAAVLLSFGHIRDAKNLDLAIRALTESPAAYLLVAGKEQSPGQKPIRYYQDIARQMGVESRCRWLHEHVPADDVGNLFTSADVILLTYARNFRSASGVLNVAVRYRKPCLASAGGGNLRSVVERYALGTFIEPDSLPALMIGLKSVLSGQVHPLWADYESENSWQRNAELVKARMFN